MAEQEVALQYEDRVQEREASRIGMWIFLGTEILFIGALFATYIIMRVSYPDGFAEASRETHLLLGSTNTAILLTSSMTMVMAVRAAYQGSVRWQFWLLVLTAALGVAFLVLKGVEYNAEYHEHLVPGAGFHFIGHYPHQAELFFWLYFLLTGLHALHLTIGVGVVSVMAALTRLGWFNEKWYTPVELTGMYWSFVDIVWIFIYPMFYLVARR